MSIMNTYANEHNMHNRWYGNQATYHQQTGLSYDGCAHQNTYSYNNYNQQHHHNHPIQQSKFNKSNRKFFPTHDCCHLSPPSEKLGCTLNHKGMRRVSSSNRQGANKWENDDEICQTVEQFSDNSQASTKAESREDGSLERVASPPLLGRLFSLQATDSEHFDESLMEMANMEISATRPCQRKKGYKSKEERVEFNQKIEKMKKTEMCRNMQEFGKCRYGAACSYAHNKDELVQKTHLPSNYKTKLCTQFHDENGYCQYGERCQFLHSTYDLNKQLSYSRGLTEEARLTWQRISQGSDCVFVNLVHGKGCVAPEKRLQIFEEIYNKDDFQANLAYKQQTAPHMSMTKSYTTIPEVQPKQESFFGDQIKSLSNNNRTWQPAANSSSKKFKTFVPKNDWQQRHQTRC